MAATYTKPDYSKQTSVFDEQQKVGEETLKSIENQANVAQQGVTALQQAQQRGLQALRVQNARATAGSRGMLGGGRGLALLRQAALERGAAEGENEMKFAGDIGQAQARAAGAQTEFLTEKGKYLQQGAIRQQKVNTALAAAQKEFDAVVGDQWVTFNDEDRARVASNIRAKVLAGETDPMVINAVEEYIYKVVSGKENAAYKYDS